MWLILLLLCGMVRPLAGCRLLDVKTVAVTKYSGESVLLPCSCDNLQTKPQGMRWIKEPGLHGQMISLSEPGPRRILFYKDTPGNLSLLISDLTKKDEGCYRCEGQRDSFRDIILTIKGCTLVDKDSTLEIVRSSGESALLPCSCSPVHAKPEGVRWTTNSTRGSHTGQMSEVSSTSGAYKGRVQMFNHCSPGNVSLLISHLSEEDQGSYVCDVGGHLKYFTILVKNTSPHYTIILVAVLLLLLLLGAVTLICLRCKGQKREHTKSGQLQEEKKVDSRVYCTSQDTRGDISTQPQKQDDVTYSTVVHGKTPRAVQVEMDTGDSTEYARIKTT